MDPVEQYRQAAIRLYGLTEKQAKRSIYSAQDDPGQWAPDALGIINLEYGDLPQCSYWAPRGPDECLRLGEEAGVGFVEYINAAVAAIHE